MFTVDWVNEGNLGMLLTERQQREVDYHKGQAERMFATHANQPVNLDVISKTGRKWWNHYWSFYSAIMKHDLRGKKVLVAGSGFGGDAIRLSELGAEVYGFDISPEIVKAGDLRKPIAGANFVTR